MTRFLLVLLPRLALLGAAGFGCSTPSPAGGTSTGGPGLDAQPAPIDPLKPGASIICDQTSPSGESSPFAYVLSALNYKLAQFPDFAAAVGQDVVADCEGVQRFRQAYDLYAAEHPGFDVDEPPAPAQPEEADTALDEPIDRTQPSETQKIAGITGSWTNYPVVRLRYDTCKPDSKGLRCPKADPSWIIFPNDPARRRDLRRTFESCSGTFIAKNWILTAAHCMVWPAIDQCMKNGTPRSACQPNWRQRGVWRVQGTFRTSPAPSDGGGSNLDPHAALDDEFEMRSYVMQNWVGTDIGKLDTTCDTPNCFDPLAIAEHDIALLYIDPRDDVFLPPRPEEDSAKRLSIVSPPDVAHWPLAIAGWGLPSDPNSTLPVLRYGTSVQAGGLGTVTAPSGTNRLDTTTTGAIYACPGDSGGPVLRIGLPIQTNIGPRTNLEAIIAVASASSEKCDPVSPVGTQVRWLATRIDVQTHRDFIRDTFKRWPQYKNFECFGRPIGTPPPALADNEVQECWGSPCTSPGKPPAGCNDDEICLGLPSRSATCEFCKDFPDPFNQGCACLQAQCLPKP